MTDTGSTIWGCVLDTREHPLPGAEIFWVAPEHEGAESVSLLDVHRVAVTDEEGRFWAPDVPRGRCLLLPDFQRIGVVDDRVDVRHAAPVEPPLPEGTEVTLRFPFAPGSFGRVLGRLSDQETSLPVSGYLVGLIQRSTGRERQAVTGEGGELGFEFLEPGPYALVVPGSVDFLPGHTELDVVGGRKIEASIALHRRPPGPTHSIALLVEDELGLPVAGAHVELRYPNHIMASVETGDDGRAVASDLFAVPMVAVARANGFWPAAAKLVEGPAGPPAARLTLRRVTRIEVKVCDAADGRVLRYANVRVRHEGGDQWDWGGVRPAPGAPPREVHDAWVLPGPVTVRAEAPGYEGAEEAVVVPPEGRTEPVTVSVSRRG